MGKTIKELREQYGLQPVEGGDNSLIAKIERCHEKCGNYLVIKFERLKTNNICTGCKLQNSEDIKDLLKQNEKVEEYKRKVKEVLYEMQLL